MAVSEAEYTAASFGGVLTGTADHFLKGWIKHLSEGFSEISGKYKPYHLGEAVAFLIKTWVSCRLKKAASWCAMLYAGARTA